MYSLNSGQFFIDKNSSNVASPLSINCLTFLVSNSSNLNSMISDGFSLILFHVSGNSFAISTLLFKLSIILIASFTLLST